MRILHILPYLYLGGTERHVYQLMKGLSPAHQVMLLAPDGPSRRLFDEANLPYALFESFDKGFFIGYQSFRTAMDNLIKSFNPDIIHVHAAHELVFLARRAVKDIPVIFTLHGYQKSFGDFSYRFSALICNRWVDQVICVSRSEKDKFLTFGGREELAHVVYNGIDQPTVARLADYVRKELNLSDEDLLIGTVGRLERNKGAHLLLEAFNLLMRETLGRLSLKLMIVGEGAEQNRLSEMCQRWGISDRVIFTGYRYDAPDLINALDIFVLPSLEEAFGLAAVEAMALKKPVVASNVGGIPEIVVSGETGILVEPSSINFKKALQSLIREPALGQRMGEQGQMRFQTLFTRESMINKTVALYDSLVKRRSSQVNP